MSSLQETRAQLAKHFSNGTANEGGRWAELWDKGDFLPWDRHMPNPALEDTLIEHRHPLGSPIIKGVNDKNKRKQALVPGCGRGYVYQSFNMTLHNFCYITFSYDVLLLGSFGYDAYGLEVSETAIERCIEEQKENGHKYPIRDQDLGAGRVSFIRGDFFKTEWLHEDVGRNGRFDLIYDYTVSPSTVFLTLVGVTLMPEIDWAYGSSCRPFQKNPDQYGPFVCHSCSPK